MNSDRASLPPADEATRPWTLSEDVDLIYEGRRLRAGFGPTGGYHHIALKYGRTLGAALARLKLLKERHPRLVETLEKAADQDEEKDNAG